MLTPRSRCDEFKPSTSALTASVLRSGLISIAICGAGILLVINNLGDLSTKPGLTTTAEVVLAGFAFTAFVYHMVRLRAARRMAAAPVPTDTVTAHVEVTRAFKQTARA